MIFFISSISSSFTGNFNFLGGPFFIPVHTNDSTHIKIEKILQFLKITLQSNDNLTEMLSTVIHRSWGVFMLKRTKEEIANFSLRTFSVFFDEGQFKTLWTRLCVIDENFSIRECFHQLRGELISIPFIHLSGFTVETHKTTASVNKEFN